MIRRDRSQKRGEIWLDARVKYHPAVGERRQGAACVFARDRATGRRRRGEREESSCRVLTEVPAISSLNLAWFCAFRVEEDRKWILDQAPASRN